jgi:hypothetical protein
MSLQEIEEYEFGGEDAVENFDELNDKYRDNTDWILECDDQFKKNEESIEIENIETNPQQVFKILSAPDLKNQSTVEISGKYVSKVSDPYERLLALKHELAECKSEIDDYAEIFKENEFITTKENFADLHKEIDLYKSKVDAFIDYNVYNSLKEDGSIQSTEINDDKTQLSSNYEKNNVLISSIINNIKSLEEEMKNDILSQEKDGKKIGNNNDLKKNVTYEVVSSPDGQINLISSQIINLETEINRLEKSIGDWSLVNLF